MTKKLKFTEVKPEPKLLKLDLGCGKGQQTQEGFVKVDKVPFDGVTVVDLTMRWPWKANSVDEVNCSMLVHLLGQPQRVHFFNELHRVLKPGAKAQIVTPMWSSHRAYIDINAQWPPVSEGFYHSLSKEWRDVQNSVDTSGLKCDFDATVGYLIHPALSTRNQEYQQHALSWNKEAAQDLMASLTKRS
jgi:predicted SAM-dependent methyltransferase